MDITYIPMAKGFVYLAACVYGSRRVLSWRVSITMEAGFCVEALEEALAKHGMPEIVNTDQGSQFTGTDFTGVLIKNEIAISMDGKGAWRDNVFVERLWRSVKYEEVYLHAYDSVPVARASIGQYLDLYNRRRPHASLDGMTPDQADHGIQLAASPLGGLTLADVPLIEAGKLSELPGPPLCTLILTAIITRIRIPIHTSISMARTTSTTLCMQRTHPTTIRTRANMARTIMVTTKRTFPAFRRAAKDPLLLWMRMKVVSGVGVVAMPVRLSIQCNRDETHLTVRDAALCDDAIGEISHRPGLSSQHRHLETVLVIEMHMHGRHMEVMMLVMRGCEPFRQFAGVMVEHVRERGKALSFAFRIEARMLQAEAGEYPVRLRSDWHSLRLPMKALSSAANSSDMLIVTRSIPQSPFCKPLGGVQSLFAYIKRVVQPRQEQRGGLDTDQCCY